MLTSWLPPPPLLPLFIFVVIHGIEEVAGGGNDTRGTGSLKSELVGKRSGGRAF